MNKTASAIAMINCFGMLDLAISFDSQVLVRDIVSGLVLIVEDAFRAAIG
ncbi:mechanosensitive ion channel [Bosea sp. AAP35]|nr:mechanosensitive ion channel [Bosea sp. AAP35]